MNRAELSERLSMNGAAPTKTYVIEAHSEDPAQLLSSIDGATSVRETDDTFLFELGTDFGEFWVDTLDNRFWRFHTDVSVSQSSSFLRHNIETRRDLDWIWLSSEHLKSIWPQAKRKAVLADFQSGGFAPNGPAVNLRVQMKGESADDLMSLIAGDERYRSSLAFDRIQIHATEPEYGAIDEVISRKGKFLVSGNSFELHSAIVSSVVSRYRDFVEACEARQMHWTQHDESGGGTLSGSIIALKFDRHIDDLERWIGELVSCRSPFRLWGIPSFDDGIAKVDAVDLHVGQRIRIDVGMQWLRIYLPDGVCGNTIARLVTNLQHRFDSALSILYVRKSIRSGT